MTPDPIFDPASQQPIDEIKITYDDLIDDTRMEESVRTLFLRIFAAFGMQNQINRSITINISQGDKLTRAWQFFQIAAADLESSDDPDDVAVPRSVLSTNGLLQSKHQFNWMRSGGTRTYRVVFGPGDGVPTHAVIIDRDDANLLMGKYEPIGDEVQIVAENVARPYGMAGLKLQFGEWRSASGVLQFWPSSIAEGTFIYLEQVLPAVVFA